MFKEKSLIRHILMNVFMVTIVIVAIVLIVVWIIMCNSYSDKIETLIQSSVSNKAEELQFELEKQINKTEHIISNLEIIEKLDMEYSDGYELLSFINELNTFVDALEYEDKSAHEPILIYTKNATLVESSYLRKIDRLERSSEILNYFSNEKEVFYRDGKIYEDFRGRQYIVIYRYLPLENECVIEIKLYFDGSIDNSEYVDKCELFSASNGMYKRKNVVTEPVLETFYLQAQVPMRRLYVRYLLYFIQLLLFASLFLTAAYFLALTAIKHAISDIMVLVEQIDSEEFLLDNAREIKWSELKKIQDSIFSLNRQIYEMNRDKYESQLLQKKLEIENLNLKINPHLLYNSLSVIKMGAFKKSDHETEKVVDLLVDYYRLMLNKGEEKIRLGQELEYLEKYIKIHEISKKVHFDVEVDISCEAYDVMIPHLILQPIVENSVFHGLGKDVANPSISFSVKYENDVLTIEICDNGTGISKHKVDKMNRKEELGYGLRNVFFRLDYYYGENYSLKFMSEENKGTCVIMTLQGGTIDE